MNTYVIMAIDIIRLLPTNMSLEINIEEKEILRISRKQLYL